MMRPRECAEAWKKVVEIYKSKKTPRDAAKNIILELGGRKAEETFATIASIKEHDGRIYGKNREYMNSIKINQDSTEWTRNNPVIRAGLDDIHTSHINQLITELKDMLYQENHSYKLKVYKTTREINNFDYEIFFDTHEEMEEYYKEIKREVRPTAWELRNNEWIREESF